MAERLLSKEQLTEGLARVIALRRNLGRDAELGARWLAVKEFQSALMRRSYGDLLQSPRYRPAGEFFLREIYGARDFEQRDSEALRVVPTLARMLPARAIHTLALAVEVDELSEHLDVGVARLISLPLTDARYEEGYRSAGLREQRERQLDIIDQVGRSLDKLAWIPFIAPLLHMMRAPAEAAGLGHLQQFLQGGFDAFKNMNGASEFLDTVYSRQSRLLAVLFAGGTIASALRLTEADRG